MRKKAEGERRKAEAASHHPSPITHHPQRVEVAAAVLLRDDGRFLLGQRPAGKVYAGYWEFPGGKVEPGEAPLAALERELREELDVQIATGSASRLCRMTVRPAGEPVLLSAWLVREWTGLPTNAAPDEHDDIGWFGLATLPALPYELVRAALLRAVLGDLARDRGGSVFGGVPSGVSRTGPPGGTAARGSAGRRR